MSLPYSIKTLRTASQIHRTWSNLSKRRICWLMRPQREQRDTGLWMDSAAAGVCVSLTVLKVKPLLIGENKFQVHVLQLWTREKRLFLLSIPIWKVPGRRESAQPDCPVHSWSSARLGAGGTRNIITRFHSSWLHELPWICKRIIKKWRLLKI